jgi:ribosomal protein L5
MQRLNVVRARLEEHFYNSLAADLMILQFDPAKQLEFPLRNLSMEKLFTTKFEDLPTKPHKGYNQTLFTSELDVPEPRKRWVKKLKNPIDYTPIPNEIWNLPPEEQKIENLQVPSAIPALTKVELRIWCEEAAANKNHVMSAIMALQSITGRRPDPLFAEKGDASRKIRAGMPMGAKVVLKGRDMYLFLDKMTQCVLPRLPDWHGINPAAPDGKIEFELSSSALGYFPDIEPHFEMFPRLFDTNVIFHANTKSEREIALVLSALQIPIKAQKDVVIQDEKEVTIYERIKLAKTRDERKKLAKELGAFNKKSK